MFRFARSRKVGRFGVLVSAVLSVMAMFLLTLSPPAVALEDDCTPAWPNVFDGWEEGVNTHNGVTLCYAEPVGFGFPPKGIVQIVDLSAGAEIQIHSDRVNPNEAGHSYNQYNKRSAEDWFSWLLSHPTGFPNDRLVSTTNASFFIDTSSSTTALSMPERAKQANLKNAHTYGYAMAENGDAAWDRAKKVLKIKGTSGSTQPPTVQMSSFPTHYTAYDVDNTFITGAWRGAVGFEPLAGDTSDISRRTFVGVSPSATKVFILTTERAITLGEAQGILSSFGSASEIQFDGGGSAQTYIDETPWGIPSYIGRPVPDVLAVYEAP